MIDIVEEHDESPASKAIREEMDRLRRKIRARDEEIKALEQYIEVAELAEPSAYLRDNADGYPVFLHESVEWVGSIITI